METGKRTLISIWRSHQEVQPKNIRHANIPYALSFTLLWAFCAAINNGYGFQSAWLFGLNMTMLFYLSMGVSMGLALMFLLVRLWAIVRWAALSAALGLAVWIMDLGGLPHFIAFILMGAGVGVCMSGAFYAFIYKLNNAERFYSAIFTLLFFCGTYLVRHLTVSPYIEKILYPAIVLLALAVCLWRYREGALPNLSAQKAAAAPKTGNVLPLIPLVFCAVSLFFGLTVVEFVMKADYSHYIIGLAVSIPIAFTLRLMLKKGVWVTYVTHIVLAVLGLLLLLSRSTFMEAYELVKPTPLAAIGSLLIGAATGMGMMSCFYILSGCLKRQGGICMANPILLGIAFIGFAISNLIIHFNVISMSDTVFLPLFGILIGVCTLAVLLTSRECKLQLLNEAFMVQAHSIDFEPDERILPDTSLTGRELEICALLIAGDTIRMIAGKLKIAHATANTHCARIYRKLNINSRNELLTLHAQGALSLNAKPVEEELPNIAIPAYLRNLAFALSLFVLVAGAGFSIADPPASVVSALNAGQDIEQYVWPGKELPGVPVVEGEVIYVEHVPDGDTYTINLSIKVKDRVAVENFIDEAIAAGFTYNEDPKAALSTILTLFGENCFMNIQYNELQTTMFLTYSNGFVGG